MVGVFLWARYPCTELCGRAPLVLAPHTIMCMGVESFTEENRGQPHVPSYISLVDVTVYSHSGHPTRGSIPRLPLTRLSG